MRMHRFTLFIAIDSKNFRRLSIRIGNMTISTSRKK